MRVTPLEWTAVLLPFVGLALVALYAGYVAYEAQKAREAAALLGPAPDYAEELARLRAETARSAADARRTLELTRDAIQRGTR